MKEENYYHAFTERSTYYWIIHVSKIEGDTVYTYESITNQGDYYGGKKQTCSRAGKWIKKPIGTNYEIY